MRLQRHLGVVRRRRNRVEDGPEQRLQVGAVGLLAVAGAVQAGPAGLRRGVHDREVEHGAGVDAGALDQVHEQLVGVVDDLGDAGVGSVDLVHHEDHRKPRLQRLAQHEPGLRQRPLGGVDQQGDAVDHRQAALDLAAEVGVARGVDDVEGDPALGGTPPPRQRTAVFFARMVMPFSRSRSFESIARSSTCWWAPNEPVCQSMASTRVVLPWSTWATIAMLRRSSRVRVGMRAGSIRGREQGIRPAVYALAPFGPSASGDAASSARTIGTSAGNQATSSHCPGPSRQTASWSSIGAGSPRTTRTRQTRIR